MQCIVYFLYNTFCIALKWRICVATSITTSQGSYVTAIWLSATRKCGLLLWVIQTNHFTCPMSTGREISKTAMHCHHILMDNISDQTILFVWYILSWDCLCRYPQYQCLNKMQIQVFDFFKSSIQVLHGCIFKLYTGVRSVHQFLICLHWLFSFNRFIKLMGRILIQKGMTFQLTYTASLGSRYPDHKMSTGLPIFTLFFSFPFLPPLPFIMRHFRSSILVVSYKIDQPKLPTYMDRSIILQGKLPMRPWVSKPLYTKEIIFHPFISTMDFSIQQSL